MFLQSWPWPHACGGREILCISCMLLCKGQHICLISVSVVGVSFDCTIVAVAVNSGVHSLVSFASSGAISTRSSELTRPFCRHLRRWSVGVPTLPNGNTCL